jgi:hypothetical protein
MILGWAIQLSRGNTLYIIVVAFDEQVIKFYPIKFDTLYHFPKAAGGPLRQFSVASCRRRSLVGVPKDERSQLVIQYASCPELIGSAR